MKTYPSRLYAGMDKFLFFEWKTHYNIKDIDYMKSSMTYPSHGVLNIGIYRKEMTFGFSQRSHRIRSGRGVK
jgi:hypothetical protein